MQIGRAFLPALSVVFLGACGGPIEPSGDERLLAENRDRFETAVGGSYTYDYRNVCFCVVDATRQVRVTVRNGERVSVVDVANGAEVPMERFRDYLTISEIFDAIQQAFDEGAASVRVEYDPTLGYPSDVFIDYDERLADEERGYVVENLDPS